MGTTVIKGSVLRVHKLFASILRQALHSYQCTPIEGVIPLLLGHMGNLLLCVGCIMVYIHTFWVFMHM